MAITRFAARSRRRRYRADLPSALEAGLTRHDSPAVLAAGGLPTALEAAQIRAAEAAIAAAPSAPSPKAAAAALKRAKQTLKRIEIQKLAREVRMMGTLLCRGSKIAARHRRRIRSLGGKAPALTCRHRPAKK